MEQQYIDVAADAMVFSREGDHVYLLLVRRKHEPFEGMWAFPGGFVDYNEDPHDAAVRELREETSVSLAAMKQLHTFGKPGRDPRGHTISVVHYAFVNAHEHVIEAKDDAAEAKWMDVREIQDLAFDHLEILEYAMKALELGPYGYRGRID